MELAPEAVSHEPPPCIDEEDQDFRRVSKHLEQLCKVGGMDEGAGQQHQMTLGRARICTEHSSSEERGNFYLRIRRGVGSARRGPPT